ncbi:MAG: multicopper oxidase domain-containing protein, partial [Proteobacteria bacterium]|nr:multicopper oxidase domain-containing protein [Pseudomonadota bacterium]
MRGLLAGLLLCAVALPASAGTYDLVIDRSVKKIDGEERRVFTINGEIGGPVLRWTEGEDVTINVTNRLAEDTSIHWHGILLPSNMDGVPGISFDGIKPGTTFTYRFKVRQSGTYWYHSHSGGQEQDGLYAPIVIAPKGGEKIKADRDHVVLLSDQHALPASAILRKLKQEPGYFNDQRRTLSGLVRALAEAKTPEERQAIVSDRAMWAKMRMDPTDLADVSGYTFLVNGLGPADNWTGLFAPGEKVRLRFVNGSAMTLFDVAIPGLRMTVVQADGNAVQPVTVDEFRLAPGETYDMIVEPREARAYTIAARS